MLITDDGSLFVGGTNRGWASRGPKAGSLERIVWTGKVPFEIQEMRARPDGFDLTFTEPVDEDTAKDVGGYQLESYGYIYQSIYGSPVVDQTHPTITSATVSSDRMSVHLSVNGLKPGNVHELISNGIRSSNGALLLHKEAYYTLNRIPRE